jgi:hypothetical protein
MSAYQKSHGYLLSLLLLMGVFQSIYTLVHVINGLLVTRIPLSSPKWFVAYTIISQVISLGLYVGIWRWQRSAIYGLLVLRFIHLLLLLTVLWSLFAPQFLSIPVYLVFQLLWFYPIKCKWALFS